MENEIRTALQIEIIPYALIDCQQKSMYNNNRNHGMIMKEEMKWHEELINVQKKQKSVFWRL